jgi:hypothetical protein
MQAADQVTVSWISEPCALIAENGVVEGAMEDGVLHIKLLNWSVTGNSSSKQCVDGGWFHNQAESLIVDDPRAVSETPKDPTGFVAIKRPIGTKLMCENPLTGDDVGATGTGDKLPGPIAHQSPILVLHSRANWGLQAQHVQRSGSGMVSMETSKQRGLGDQEAPGCPPWPE